MSDLVIVTLITSTPSILAAILGFVNRWHIAEVGTKVAQLEVNTNSKMDRLLQVTSAAEYAKGLKQGKEETPPSQ